MCSLRIRTFQHSVCCAYSISSAINSYLFYSHVTYINMNFVQMASSLILKEVHIEDMKYILAMIFILQSTDEGNNRYLPMSASAFDYGHAQRQQIYCDVFDSLSQKQSSNIDNIATFRVIPDTSYYHSFLTFATYLVNQNMSIHLKATIAEVYSSL